MKKLLCSLLVLCCSPMVNITALGNDAVFKDVDKTHWAYECIKDGVEKGYFAGYTDGSFKPESNVTRAEAVKILTMFLDRTIAKPAESKFTDVDVEAWYAPYVNVSDYLFPEKWVDENLFRPDAPITREEVVFAVVTAMQYDYKIDRADLSYLKSFADKEKVGFGLEDYMAIALEFDVISGYPDNTIRPDANITRGEFATLMSRISAQKAILDGRRQQVFDYMNKAVSVLWTSDEDFTYALDSLDVSPEESPDGRTLIHIKKGRVYRGVPYSYAAGDMGAFLDYSIGTDENGIHTVSGLTWRDFSTSGGSSTRTARLGSDCAASIQLAYGSIGHGKSIGGVSKLSPYHGYPHVGKYNYPKDYNVHNTSSVKGSPVLNDPETIYKAFSQLQKGDLMIKMDYRETDISWVSHSRMVADVNIVYDEAGNVDPLASTITLLDQTKGNVLSEKKYYDEALGCDVYYIGNYHLVKPFYDLYLEYQPATAEILIDPKPIEKPVITDTQSEHTIDTLFSGKIKSTWMIASATIDIKDSFGNITQSATILPKRATEVQYFSSFVIGMSNFKTSEPGFIKGGIDLETLPAGEYKCSVTVRLVSNEEFTVREFNFKI